MVTFILHSDGFHCSVFCSLALFPRADTDKFYLLFDLIRNVIDQLLRIIPSKTRIRDGFSINMLADLLAARFKIALDHNALDEIMDLLRVAAAVKNFLYDTNQLHIAPIRVTVLCAND